MPAIWRIGLQGCLGSPDLGLHKLWAQMVQPCDRALRTAPGQGYLEASKGPWMSHCWCQMCCLDGP